MSERQIWMMGATDMLRPIAAVLRGFGRPTSRSRFSIPTMFLLYFLVEISKSQRHAGTLLFSPYSPYARAYYVFCLVMAFVFGIEWSLSVPGRLQAISWKKAWIILFIAAWALVLLAMAEGSTHQFLAAVAIALLVQMPLMLLPSRNTQTS